MGKEGDGVHEMGVVYLVFCLSCCVFMHDLLWSCLFGGLDV